MSLSLRRRWDRTVGRRAKLRFKLAGCSQSALEIQIPPGQRWGAVMGRALCGRRSFRIRRSQLPWLMTAWRDKVWEAGPVGTRVQAGLRSGREWSSEREQLRQVHAVLSLGRLLPAATGPGHEAVGLQIRLGKSSGQGSAGAAEAVLLCPPRSLLVFPEGTISPKVLAELFSARRGVCVTCWDALAAVLMSPRASWAKFGISSWAAEVSPDLGSPSRPRWMQIAPPGSRGGPYGPPLRLLISCFLRRLWNGRNQGCEGVENVAGIRTFLLKEALNEHPSAFREENMILFSLSNSALRTKCSQPQSVSQRLFLWT